MPLKIQNSKEIKELKKKILNQWGVEFKTDFGFLLSARNKVYLVSKDISKVDYSQLRLEVVGLYFGEIMDNGELRLSIEGSQMIGKDATQNIVEIPEEDVKKWLFGKDIQTDSKCSGFVIIKSKNDFLGTGKIRGNEILNFVPKTRRISSED